MKLLLCPKSPPASRFYEGGNHNLANVGSFIYYAIIEHKLMKKGKKYAPIIYLLIPTILISPVIFLVFPDYIYFTIQLVSGLLILLFFNLFAKGRSAIFFLGILLLIFLAFEYAAREFTESEIFFSFKALFVFIITVAGVLLRNYAERLRESRSFRWIFILMPTVFYASVGVLVGGVVSNLPILLFYNEMGPGIYIFYTLSVFLPIAMGIIGGSYGVLRIFILKEGYAAEKDLK